MTVGDVIVWFGSVLVKKMSKPMKSSSTWFGLAFCVFQKINLTKLVGLDWFG